MCSCKSEQKSATMRNVEKYLTNNSRSRNGRNFLIEQSIFSREAPLLVRDMLVNFWDVLPETKSVHAGIWVGSFLTWLSSDSLYLPEWIELDLESSGWGRG